MAVTAASLKAAWPEFDAAADALVTSKISQAERSLSESAFADSDTYDDAVTLKACHLLALTPDGRAMRLDPEGKAGRYGLGVTIYGQELDQLIRASTVGLARLSGDGS